jgi:predicted ribosome quality control (RQC) complex YloA/Tae2 family protein
VGKIEIKLRADLSPIENMERYFHLSRRLSAARSRIALKIEKVKARLSELESLGGRVAEAGEPERMSRLLEKAKIPGARGAPRPPQTPAEGRAAFKEYFIPGAGRILAGGSAEENDELTFRTARGNDLWFHVAGFPGAHVVAPMPRGREPSPELIRTCALIAASRSRAPEGEKVEVAWCRQKHLRKPRGAARGAVLMSQEKRLLVEVKKGAFAEYLIL